MNILTFDIEDWWAYDFYSIGKKEDYLPRLDKYLNEILDLLDEKNIRATFFCLGIIAKEHPTVIKTIAKRGHHIGSHSYKHRLLSDLTPDEFYEDTKLSLDCIENLTGIKINTYRAPAFSISENTKWALEILIDLGIKYDSSIFNAIRNFGGYSDLGLTGPSIIKINGLDLYEFPVTPNSLFGKNIIYSGGGYFRLMPYSIIKHLSMNTNYLMTYFHIKDFDIQQKRIKARLNNQESYFERYIKNYYGIKKAYKKFKRYISDFEFLDIEQAAKQIDWSKASILELNKSIEK